MDAEMTQTPQLLINFDLLHGFVTAVAIDHQYAASSSRKMFLWHIVAAAWVEHVDHRIVAREQPQPPLMTDFTSFFHENSPSRFVGVKESGPDVMPSKGFVNRSQSA